MTSSRQLRSQSHHLQPEVSLHFPENFSRAATACKTRDTSAAAHQRAVLSTDPVLTAAAGATEAVLTRKVLCDLPADMQRRHTSSQTGNDVDCDDEDDDTPSYIMCGGAHPVQTIESLVPRTSSPIPADRSATLPLQQRPKVAATGSGLSKLPTGGTSVIDVRRPPPKDRKRFLTDDDTIQLQDLTTLQLSTRRIDDKDGKENAKLMADDRSKSKENVGKANKRGGESHLVKTVSRLKQYFGMAGGCRLRDADGDSERDICADEVHNERRRTVSKSAGGDAGATEANRKRSESSEQTDHPVRCGKYAVARLKVSDDDQASVDEDTAENSATLVDVSDSDQVREMPGCHYSESAVVGEPTAAVICRRKTAVVERFIPCQLDDLRQRRGKVDGMKKTSAKSSNGLKPARSEETRNGTEPSLVTTVAPGITVRVAPVANRHSRVVASRGSLKETDDENWEGNANEPVAAAQVTADRIRYRRPRRAAGDCGTTGNEATCLTESNDAIFRPPVSAATGSSSTDAMVKAIVSRSTANVQRWLNYNERVLCQESSVIGANDRACYTQQQKPMPSPSRHSRDFDHRRCYVHPKHCDIGLHNGSTAAGVNPVFGAGGSRGRERRGCGDDQLQRSNSSRFRSWHRGDAASATEANDSPDDMGLLDVRMSSRRRHCHRHRAGISPRSSSVQSALADRRPTTASTTPATAGRSELTTGNAPSAGCSLTVGDDDRSSQFESRLGPSLLQFVADVIESLENAAQHDDDSSDYSSTDDDSRHHENQRRQRHQQHPRQNRLSTPSRPMTHRNGGHTSPAMRRLEQRNSHRHSRSSTPQWQQKQRHQLRRRGTSDGDECSCRRKDDCDGNQRTPPFFESNRFATRRARENRQPEGRQPALDDDRCEIPCGNVQKR